MGTHTKGLWMTYFLAQVPLIVTERATLALLKRQGIVVPNVARIVATLAVQNDLGHRFFWAAVVGPLADQVVGNIAATLQATVAALQGS